MMMLYSSLAYETNYFEALLLTASATTGWLDWIHGELWLFPFALLRVPLDLETTVIHGTWPTTNRQHPCQRTFDAKMLEELLALKGSRWIPLEQIRRAYFCRGLLTDELQLELVNGRLIKFLWFPWDGAWEPLYPVLRERLGDGLTIK